jgi:hypothetical protein
VVLEVETDAWKVNERLDAGLAELGRVTWNDVSVRELRPCTCRHTDSGSLKDQWRAQSAAADDDLLASPKSAGDALGRVQWLGGDSTDTNGTIALKNDLVNLGVALKVEILVFGTGTVDVCVGRVGAATSVTRQVSKS